MRGEPFFSSEAWLSPDGFPAETFDTECFVECVPADALSSARSIASSCVLPEWHVPAAEVQA